MAETIDLWQGRKDFLAYLRFTKGYSEATCYNYHSDLGIWGRWLEEAGKDWRSLSHIDAAREAGLATVLVDRRADYPEPRTGAATHGHPRATSFTEIDPG